MDVSLTGVEIHALRGLVEEAVAKLDKEIAAAKGEKPSEAIKARWPSG